jgi:hypothetical protein
MNIDDIDEILPKPEQKEPDRGDDPKIENMGALMPIPQVPPVHIDQNHLEHIKSHDEFMAAPEWQRITPEGKQAMEAHTQSHIAMLYGLVEAKIDETTGDIGGAGDVAPQPNDQVGAGAAPEAVPQGPLAAGF